MSDCITPAVIRSIEENLSEPKYYGVPIGATLNDHLITCLYNKKQTFNMRNRLVMRALMIYHAMLFHLPRRKPILPTGRPVLATCISARKSIIDLMVPVFKKLGKEKCVIVRSGPPLSGELKSFIQIDGNDLLQRSHGRWLKEYMKCYPRWNRSLVYVCEKFGLPKGTRELLALRIMINTQNIARFIDVLSYLRPSIVVTEYDRNALWSCLVLAAKSVGIPTTTLVHGVMNERAIGYCPVIADSILCWGDLQKETLISEGVDPEIILNAGCPRLTRELSLTGPDARKLMGLNPDIPCVMLGTSPGKPQEIRELVDIFCNGCGRSEEWSAFVRLHPSERMSDYRELSEKHHKIVFFENKAFSLEVSLAASDVVVVKDSGVGSDALVKRKPTIVLSPQDDPKGHGADLVEKAGCPLARSEDDLRRFVSSIIFNKRSREMNKGNTEKYVERLCSGFGEDSVAKIVSIVNKILEKDIRERMIRKDRS